MQIHSISINNYRSINKGQLQLLDTKTYNLLIGKNNSGKSNIIRLIPLLHDLLINLPRLIGSINLSVYKSLSQVQDLFFNGSSSIVMGVIFKISDEEKETYLSAISEAHGFKSELFNKRENVIKLKFAITLGSTNNVDYRIEEMYWSDIPLISIADRIMRISDGSFTQAKFDEQYGTFSQELFGYLRFILSKLKQNANRFKIIKAVRKIGGTSPNDDTNTSSRILNLLDFSGDRVLDDISIWRSPPNNYGVYYPKYKKLNTFISNLLGINIELIVSQDKTQLLLNPIDSDGTTFLSYKSWGSSVEELIVLLVDILSSLDESIIALEEPEIHLDPFMQKKFIQFLKENTNHQYFISSHSNVLINSFTTPDSAIFKIYKDLGSTSLVKADEQVLNTVLDDIGIKASDLLQTNGIVWVEGPSDRIFINKWISLKDPNLKEGSHYSVMFYGGRLLSHLTADISNEEEIVESNNFIKLLKLNRNIAMIMDSDKSSVDDDINLTKQRIVDEIKKIQDRSMVWITDGREIENYIPADLYDNILGIKGMTKYTRVLDLDPKYIKIKSANELIKSMDDNIFHNENDLDIKMSALVEKIKYWNKSDKSI